MAPRRSTTPGFRDERYRAVIDQLVEHRRTLGLTQSAVAERLGLHKQFVSRVETFQRRLDFVEFVDFATAVDADPAELIAKLRNRPTP